MKISHKDFIWLGGIALLCIAAYAWHQNAVAQGAANATPQLGTSPNYVQGAPTITLDSGGSTAAPVFAPVSSPDFNYQVQSIDPSQAMALDYTMPTMPSMPNVAQPLKGVNTTLTVPEVPSLLQQFADPLGIFS
jgi:hypothetical protein